MGFRVLGGVEVCSGERMIDIGPAKQQRVLVALLIDANRVVPADRLMQRVWGEHAPVRAKETLRTYLSRLREALAGLEDVTIARRAGGYVLALDPDAVDMHRFRALVTRARASDDRQALALLNEALDLWRGEAFAGMSAEWIDDLRSNLDAERFAAELDHADLLLGDGGHGEILATLSVRAADRPLDERLAGQLMLALYQDGRVAEALMHYDRTRTRLADELGVDPGPRLRELHQRILLADPTLSASHTGEPTPRQLPTAPAVFTGREDDLARLSDDALVSVIAGAGGIGKTWLALHWAHRNAERFPDGQLFVDLRGFAPNGEPMSSAVAVRGFLEALGVSPAQIPVEHGAQAALYRSLVARRRMLVVLDNARDAEQVGALLPGSPTCRVLVTSRDRLIGLVTGSGAQPVPLAVLSSAQARDVLVGRIGLQRIDAEPAAVTELLRWCAGLPLALGIVAANAAAHPHLPLATWADELRDTATRLDALGTGDPATTLSAVLSWSVAALTPEQARALGLLALMPGPDTGIPAATSLLDRPALGILRELQRLSLVDEHPGGRWRMHDLVRLHAAGHARTSFPDSELDAALRRVVDHYTLTSSNADRLLDPHRPPLGLYPATPTAAPQHFTDQCDALAWFAAEHAGLLAAQQIAAERAWHPQVWLLAWSTDYFHLRRGRLSDQLKFWRTGLSAAHQLDDETKHAAAHRQFGRVVAELGHRDDGLAHLHEALALAGQFDDPLGQVAAHRAIGLVYARQKNYHLARRHAQDAVRVLSSEEISATTARARNAVGWYAACLGDYAQARIECEAALKIFDSYKDPAGMASTVDSLGFIAHGTGDYATAAEYYGEAVRLNRIIGDSGYEADTLVRLGHTHVAQRRFEDAHEVWRRALVLYLSLHRSEDADRLREQLRQLDADPCRTTRHVAADH